MKQTKFMQVMFSAVENGDEELTNQVAEDIEAAKTNGEVDTDEISYVNLGSGKVLVYDKVNGQATIAEMPEDQASTYDLEAVPDEELDKFLHPMEDGVTPDENVQDLQVEDDQAPAVAEEYVPTVEEAAAEEEDEAQHQFSVSTDNVIVQRIFSDVEFYDRIFSETIESDETSVIGDLKIEKVDDDTVIVTSESTGDQAKVVLDGDEMEVTELDQKELSYSNINEDEPALYSVMVNEEELGLLQYLFSDDEETEGEEEDECCDTGIDCGEDAMNPLFIVGIDTDNHQLVDAPVYDPEEAQELVEHLSEIGVQGVNVFDDPSEAREYASELLQGEGVTISEVEQLAEPEEHEYSEIISVYTTRYFSDDEMEFTSDFMERCYADNAETEKIEDAITNGDQVETSNEIITPVDSETAVVEDKSNGEFTKATLDEDGGIDMEVITEEEADELTKDVTTEAPEEDGEEKEYSESETFEYVTNYSMRLYSDDEANEDVEDAIESGEEIETDTEKITPIDSETAVVEDKTNGEFTKVTVDEDGNKETEAITKEEAEELFSYIEVEGTEQEKALSTATRFFAEAMAPQAQAAQAPAPAPAVAENVDPNAVPVDENGNPIEEPKQPEVASVEAIEDKALVAVQSIQAAANDAVLAIQQAKEAPAPQAQETLQEAQFSEYEYDDEEDIRTFSESDTLTNWLGNLH